MKQLKSNAWRRRVRLNQEKFQLVSKTQPSGEHKTASLEGDTWNVSSSFPKIKRKRVELDEKREANHIL